MIRGPNGKGMLRADRQLPKVEGSCRQANVGKFTYRRDVSSSDRAVVQYARGKSGEVPSVFGVEGYDEGDG